MEIEDLMVGDWVKLMNSHGEWIDYEKIDYNLFSIYLEYGEDSVIKFEPVPLTNDILCINGWIDSKYNDKQIYIELESNNLKIRNGHNEYIFPKPIYVHELQHSLKLCNLNELSNKIKVK